MTAGIHPLIAGNWKMNGTSRSVTEILSISNGYTGLLANETDLALFLPATLLARAVELLKGTGIVCGGQDCHWEQSGAHTGDISAEMLADAGAKYVLVGHSERRQDHHESNEIVRKKAEAALRAGLVAVICIGETEDQRLDGKTSEVLSEQIRDSVPTESSSANTVIAYEPVWAIGTGNTPSPEDVGLAHRHIRTELASLLAGQAGRIRILYGGSVKPANAGELLSVANVDGALVGGASLKAADFLGIAEAYYKI